MFREFVAFRKLRGRSSGNAEGFAGHGVGERVSDSPLFLVVSASTNDAKRAIVAAREIIVPLSLVHEVAVLRRLLVVKQSHRSAAPDFANATARVAVEHESGGVKTLHGTKVASLCIEGILTCHGGGGSHREGELAVLAIIDKAHFGPVVAVGVISTSDVAVKVSQGSVEGVVGNIGSAFPGKEEKGHHARAGGIEVAAAVAGESGAASGPGVVVLGACRVVDPVLNILENFGIAGAEVALGERNSTVTDIPGIGMGFDVSGPLADDFEVLVVPG